jgi:hypothetical protein
MRIEIAIDISVNTRTPNRNFRAFLAVAEGVAAGAEAYSHIVEQLMCGKDLCENAPKQPR